MTFEQSYLPAGSLWLSALLASVPILLLLGAMALLRLKAHWSAILGLSCAFLVAYFLYRMPGNLILSSTLFGATYGLFPVGWIILNALFVFGITEESGNFRLLREFISRISQDKSTQALLIAFCFGAFIEGAAGFGTPVAITAAMLYGLGFSPQKAVVLALIGNTAPVAFGGLGTPVIALSTVTGLPLMELTSVVGRQLTLVGFLIPFWLVAVEGGWKGLRKAAPQALVCGSSYALTQFLVSEFHGPWLVGIAASLVSTFSLVLYLELSKKERPFRQISWRTYLPALLPWILVVLLVFSWGLPAVKSLLNLATLKIPFPFLHQKVLVGPPLASSSTFESAVFSLDWLANAGTSLFLSGILAGLVSKMSPRRIMGIFFRTLKKLRLTLLTVSLMMGFGYLARFSGMQITIGLALASTGALFPFFSPILGWLGVAITGSDTSSNVLFGPLQKVTALSLGLSPLITSAANSSGGVMGKMIAPPTLVIASAAVEGREKEANILRLVFFHSLALVLIMGALVLLQVYLFPGSSP